MTQIIDGKLVSAALKQQVAAEVAELKEKGIEVTLAVIIVGDDPASRIYVNNKKKACAETGITSLEFALPATTTQSELIDLIKKLNADSKVNGILCQMPLPKGLDAAEVTDTILPIKDVDAFHETNVGKIMMGKYDFLPCTPAGIMELLKYYNISTKGKRAVVIGRSDIVGKPMAMLLLHSDATVTVCHSRTEDIASVCREADILVSAVGKADFVTPDMVKEGAVVIDVGMNRNSEGRLCGDVCFDEIKEKCSAITPVPGGVGPMTIATLMKNTLTAAKKQNSII